MGHMRKFIVAGSIVLAIAAPAGAQPLAGTYGVGPGGTYANIAAAIAALSANGVAGAVTFLVTANDTGPWALAAVTGQGPANPIVFDGQGAVTLTGPQPLITLSGISNCTLQGFTAAFGSGATAGIAVNAPTANGTIRSCNFTAPVVTTGAPAISIAGGSGFVIEDSTFGGGYQALESATVSDALTVQRCRILGGGWRIMSLGGTNNTLRNNFIHGSSNYGINAGLPSFPTSASNLKIHHNSVYIVHPTSGSQYCSLRWYTSVTNSEVLNNVFTDVFPTATTSIFTLWCSGVLRPAVMNYNVFNPSTSTAPFFAAVNLTLSGWQGLGFDANSLQADPLFVAPGATPPDLRLSSGSPCATAGTLLASVPADFFGSPRVPPVDVGAHELTSNNALAAVTSGGGVGDLNLSLGFISPGALEGWTLITFATGGPAGTGPILGIQPDAVTWSIFSYPLFPGNPFHFPVGVPGVYPAVPLALGPGTLSSLSGSVMDAVVILLGPGGGFGGYSNVARVAW